MVSSARCARVLIYLPRLGIHRLLSGTPPATWRTTCGIFLSHLASHIDGIKNRLLTSANDTDRGLRFSLHSSRILSSMTLAQITCLLAMNPPSKDSGAEFEQKCAGALALAIKLVEELKPDEFLSLDHVFLVGAFNFSFPGTLQPARTCSSIGYVQ
jgi:hypothetical protein